MPSTSTKRALRSSTAWIVSEGPETQAEFLDSLEPGELMALPYLFEVWAMDHQLPPEGDWRTWAVMGGRGAGKTRAGSEWVRSQVEGPRPTDPGKCKRLALIGETVDQVREVMVFGESGILACSPPDRRPEWQATRKCLIWPNGATAQVFSAHDPEGLRGPQFDGAWVDEYGCAAIDKGTNQPNKFLDPKSSESRLPYFSNGRQDELMQMQYLRAMTAYWTDPANNPISEEYEAPMLEFERCCVWAWDARPYPWFPNNRSLWSDGDNYGRGHWLTGRASARSLASVVDEICQRSNVTHYDVSTLYGHLRGYGIEDVSEGRAALQPLMLRYGFDAVDRAGMLKFRLRDGLPDQELDPEWLVRDGESDAVVEETRASAVELAGRVRLRFVESNGDYEVIAEEAILPDETTQTVSVSELPISMTRAEGRQTVERWLSESRVARDTARFMLPPSMMSRGAGDVVSLPEEGGRGLYRIDRTEQMGLAQRVEAVRIEPETYVPIDIGEIRADVKIFGAPVPVTAVFMDLPLMSGQEIPHAPHLAVTANPWPGSAALYSSTNDTNYALNTLVEVPTPIGLTETPLKPACSGLYDRGAPVRVRMLNGQLESVEETAMLDGANLCAIGDGTPGKWELFQFQTAELIGTRTYNLSHRLRGQAGTETVQTEEWPIGSLVVRLNGSLQQMDLKQSELGLERFYRIGPGDRSYTDPSYQSTEQSFEGIGLRPYAPVHLKAQPINTGDVDIRWIRRTRIDGDRWNRPEVPLGEESESYLVRVSQTGTVVREEIVDQSNWTYESADKAADGLVGFYQIEVAQISASFGVGPFTTITLAA